MTDMLVNLLKLESAQPLIDALRAKHQIIVRRASAWELSRVREFANRRTVTPRTRSDPSAYSFFQVM